MSNLDWFNEARYGMFIHWGAYSAAARAEWVLNRERIPYDEYTEKYVKKFKAEKFDPRAWARLAKEAGMKYMVLTTRHHDGFALWDTKTSDFNAAKLGPKKDLVRLFADGVRAEGLKVGFYFSYADWHHPDYPGAYCRDWPQPWNDPEKQKRFSTYYHAQLEELLTDYGKVDILWYDGFAPFPHDGEQVNRRMKELQPHIIINDRNGEPWDFKNCEQAINPAPAGTAWEACMTLNDTWGYHAGDFHYKPACDVIRMLIETACNGGNLLLNVGPKADGTIPAQAAKILRQAGKWLKRNGEFLPNSDRSPFSWNTFGRITMKGGKVYVHIFRSTGKELCLAEIGNKVLSARYVATGKKLRFEQHGERLFLKGLPVPLPDPLCTSIVLEVEGEPKPITEQTSFWIPG